MNILDSLRDQLGPVGYLGFWGAVILVGLFVLFVVIRDAVRAGTRDKGRR
jgi:hypothetical protein